MIVLSATMLMGCNEEKEVQKDYAVISGTIKNPIENRKIRLYDYENQKSEIIEVDEEGRFRDTLRLESPTFFNASYSSMFPLYLSNGMELNLKFKDSAAKPEASGKGSITYNVLKKKNELAAGIFEDYKAFFSQPEDSYKKDLKQYNEDFKELIAANKEELDSNFVNKQEKSLETFNKQMDAEFERFKEINAKLAPGKPSPEFTDYINYNGGTSSLKDILGQYIYIDMWATWCGPCKYEIPFLLKLEEEYKDKDIKFVSISIDARKDEDKWRKMIEDKELTGTQLLADNEYQSQFVQDYFIQGIPRFIILDPQGNIVDYDAPRPSEPKLREVLDGLDI
ncbi:Thiol-disulfide isomerase or thioredoxin [Salegentibacter holothuriorum]|uniref:Thiol-disulfide isomerase or thioredoxin n=2 Tax=Salegentibacter holothuriorum TaxID=241145 RepID=A0A1T5DJ73_9FLAO|nr:Thiol-disulfide isomerase or thioredoxin [Salegentibacter holothuriorum]